MNPEAIETAEFVEGVADRLLSGPFTLELTAWDDGDFQVVAFHTIEPNYKLEDEDSPFHRERILYSSMEDEEAIVQEVVRRDPGGTRTESVWSELLAGGTDDYDAPTVEDYADGLNEEGSA